MPPDGCIRAIPPFDHVGLLEHASKEEKAAEAGLLQCIADMEKLEVDVQGVADVTIGEILEREPELRAEIEEELKNNVSRSPNIPQESTAIHAF